MERKVLNLEQHVEFLYDELENKENEISELKVALLRAKEYYKKKNNACDDHHDNDVEDKLRQTIEDQAVKINCLKEIKNEIFEKHNEVVNDFTSEVKAQEKDIKYWQELYKQQIKEVNDQKEELAAMKLKIEELENNRKDKVDIELSSSILEELKISGLETDIENLKHENDELKKKHYSVKIQDSPYCCVQGIFFYILWSLITIALFNLPRFSFLPNEDDSKKLLSLCQCKEKCNSNDTR